MGKIINIPISDLFISEYLRRVNQIVAEERGISMEVSNIANAIAKRIVSIANSVDSKTNVSTGKKYREGTFRYDTLWDVGINVNWRITYYDTMRGDVIPKTKSSFTPYTKTAFIDAIAVNGTIDLPAMKESIQHEIFHAFEMHKTKDRNLPNVYYVRALNRLRELDENKDPILYGINAVIYLSFESEQKAFYNGAYKELINSGDNLFDFDNAIKKTKFFQWYAYIEYLYPRFKALQGEVLSKALNELEHYNLQWNEFIEITAELIESLKMKTGRLKAKVIDDEMLRHPSFGEPTPNNYFKIYENNNLGLSGWRYFILKRFQEVLNNNTV